MKRTLALFLTLCMALSMFSFPAFAAEADVAVLDEAALVETETNNEPVADVTAPTEAVEAPVAAGAQLVLSFTDTYTDTDAAKGTVAAELPYTAAAQDVKTVLSKVSGAVEGAAGVTVTGLTFNGKAASEVTDKLTHANDTAYDATVTATLSDGSTLTGHVKVSVVPVEVKYSAFALNASTKEYSNVSGLSAAYTFVDGETAVQNEIKAATTVKAYTDAFGKDDVTANLTTVGYPELWLKATVTASSDWTLVATGDTTVDTISKLALAVGSATEATAAYANAPYTFVYDGAAIDDTDDLKKADLAFTGDSANYGKVDPKGTVSYDVVDATKITNIDNFDWTTHKETINGTAGDAITNSTSLPSAVGKYYVKASIADNGSDKYIKGSNIDVAPVLVEITKAAAAKIELKTADGQELDGQTFVVKKDKDVVSFTATSTVGKTPDVTVTGSDIGFEGDNSTKKPYLPGTYTVEAKVEKAADGSYPELTASATFTIAAGDTDVNFGTAVTDSDKNLNMIYPDAKAVYKGTDNEVSNTYATLALTARNNETGKTYAAGDTLDSGVYTVNAVVTPKELALTDLTSDGYKTSDPMPAVAAVKGATVTTALTIKGTNDDNVTLAAKGEAQPVAVDTSIRYSTQVGSVTPESLLAAGTYTVKLGGNDITDTAAYKLGFARKATTWGTDDEFTKTIDKPGEYQIVAYTEKNGDVSFSACTAETAKKFGFTVLAGKLNIVFNAPSITADNKDHTSEIDASCFTVTDGTTGDAVKAVIDITGMNPSIVKEQGTYTFKAKVEVPEADSELYLDPTTGKAYDDTYSFTVKGANTATATFVERDRAVDYTGVKLSFTKDDLKFDGIKAADAEVTFGIEVYDEAKQAYVPAGSAVDAGKYKVTAYLAANTTAGTNASQDTIYVTVNPVAPIVSLDDAAKKDAEFTYKDGTTNFPIATVTGVLGTSLSDTTLETLYYKDGVLLVGQDGKPLTGVSLQTVEEPGVYTATYQWKNKDSKGDVVNGNYTDSAVVTSKKYTLKAKAATQDQIPTPLPDFKAEYGAEKSGLYVGENKTTSDPSKLKGEFRIASSATGKITDLNSFQAVIEFVPTNEAYAPVVVDGYQTVKVNKAVFTEDDVKVVGTKVTSFDGNAYGLTSFDYTPKFESDRQYLKVEYSVNGSTGWTTDITKATRTTSGSITVRISDIRADDKATYETAKFLGYVEIGQTELSTLELANTTAVYTDDGSKLEPQLVIKTPGAKDVVVPASDVDYKYADYKDKLVNATFKSAATLGDLHVAKNGYYVRAAIKSDVLNKYSNFNFGDNTQLIAYATYTVMPITLDETKLAKSINTTVEVGTKVDLNKHLEDITLTEVGKTNDDDNFAIVKTNTGKDLLAGEWAWKDEATVVRDAYADYTLVYTLSEVGRQALTKGKQAAEGDYVNPTVTLNPTVTPIDVVKTGEAVVTPKSVVYGTTLGELEVNTDNIQITTPAGLKGTWVWAEGNDYVMPVGKHATKPADGVSAADAQLVLVFRAAEKPLNYSGNAYATVEVTKGEPTLVVTNTTMGYTGNPASLKVETNNTEAEPKLTWYDANGNTIAGAPTQIGSYKVKVSLPETNSFLAKSVTVDYTITYNQTGIEGFVYRLYAVALGREPDQSGYTMWVNLLKSKEYTPKSVANGFIFSPEFQNRKYDNATFLKVMYSTFMDREPDASGYTMWLKGLNSGEYTREFVFQGFADSREFTNICARYGL